MDFLKKRVKQYQEKKLDEALTKIKFHSDMRKQLTKQVQIDVDTEISNIRQEISFHDEMISIWKKNAEKIKKELKKIEN